MSSVPSPPGTQITSSCGQSAKVMVGVSVITESLGDRLDPLPDQMHLGAGHAGKHLQRPGEIELRYLWEYEKTDLKRCGH